MWAFDVCEMYLRSEYDSVIGGKQRLVWWPGWRKKWGFLIVLFGLRCCCGVQKRVGLLGEGVGLFVSLPEMDGERRVFLLREGVQGSYLSVAGINYEVFAASLIGSGSSLLIIDAV